MLLKMLGTNISLDTKCAEITSIEHNGFWILIEDAEYFVPFEKYPDFRTAAVDAIFNFEYEFGALHWPDLDVDIEIEALKHPEHYPLKFVR